MSEGFLAASWLGLKSEAAERNLTNRSALARSLAKLRRLDTLIEVLSTLSHQTPTLCRPRRLLPILGTNALQLCFLTLSTFPLPLSQLQ